MLIDIQRLRNITTGLLHTQKKHLYEDIENITGLNGFMPHNIDNARDAILPYLRSVAHEKRLWNNKYDPYHIGHIDVPVMGKGSVDFFLCIMRQKPSKRLDPYTWEAY